jgi:hypothetical protein
MWEENAAGGELFKNYNFGTEDTADDTLITKEELEVMFNNSEAL